VARVKLKTKQNKTNKKKPIRNLTKWKIFSNILLWKKKSYNANKTTLGKSRENSSFNFMAS